MIIPVNSGNGYNIIAEKGALSRAERFLRLDRKVLIVTDDGVPEEYAKALAKKCKEPHIKTVKQGEDSKSIKVFEELLLYMLSSGFTRTDCVAAVGGGVVGDLAGFVAASFMRGVDFYNIPTTVLSQVDSSIGGKTAINLGGIKNIAGAFYQPSAVLIDASLLQTLPKRQISNGLAESVKMALTSDESLFEIFESGKIHENLEEIIIKSLCIKKSVVEQDEKESGIRKILNFGHTIGHGIESFEGLCGLYHGECVALGMLPMCGEQVRCRLLPVLKALSLPTECSLDINKVFKAMTHDKKTSGDDISVTTVEKIGTFKTEKVPIASLFEKLKYFEGGSAI